MKDWPELYSCRFLEPGLVSYEDSDAGIARLTKETIDKMSPSFIGKPVVIDHQDVTPENLKKYSKGYVTRVFFNPEDGWFWCDFIVDDDEAKKCIDEMGYSVSCAFNVLDVVEGGLWHDIKYDGEITDGSFTHLALVKEPRYEDSKIFKQLPQLMMNGKLAYYKTEQTEDNQMFKIFKKADNDKKEDFSNLHVAIDGQEVPVSEILASYANAKKKEEEKRNNEKRMAKDEDIVDVNGNTISIGELVKHYKSSKTNEKDEEKSKKDQEEIEAKKKNDKEAEEKKAKEEEDKKNAKAAEESAAKAKEDEEKKNSKANGDKFFAELENARANGAGDDTPSPAPMTRAERASAWQKRNARA